MARGLHVVPEFLGNRAPFADPNARGVIARLGMETGLDNLVALYLAGICGLGYGARQIVRALHEENVAIDTIVVSGGAGQSALVRQLLADTTGKVVADPISQEPVLLGSAIFGAVASSRYVVHVGGGRDLQTQPHIGRMAPEAVPLKRPALWISVPCDVGAVSSRV
jgi:D-ribulokinase